VATNAFLRASTTSRRPELAAVAADSPAPAASRPVRPKAGHPVQEHLSIVDREPNSERRTYYQLLCTWGSRRHYNLTAEDVDGTNDGQLSATEDQSDRPLHFGDHGAEILAGFRARGRLPYREPSEPAIGRPSSATVPRSRIGGATLHSYRYACRARQGRRLPERLPWRPRHNSKAVHRAYARKAQVRLPSLESYENRAGGKPTVPFPGIVSEPNEPTPIALVEGTAGIAIRSAHS
jgi:hypothetical protein